jgi:Cupin-like domain
MKPSLTLCASNRAPWNLSGFPNYERAVPIDSIKASDISESEFLEHYVNRNRPCRLIGAIEHWPACTRWRQVDYLKLKTRNSRVEVSSFPGPELLAWANDDIKQKLLDDVAENHREMLFHAFLSELPDHGDQLVLPGCVFEPGSPIEALQADLGGFKFLPNPKPARRYTAHRAFIYRDSYTDWHFHSSDETLMTQVVGDKEVLILAPDDTSWKALLPVIEDKGYLFDVDTTQYKKFGELRPYRTVVEQGDALYIPVFWWHAVESIGADFGITVASTFLTPLHINGDLRFPAVRKMVGTYLWTRHAPLLLGAIAYSSCHLLFERCFPGFNTARG